MSLRQLLAAVLTMVLAGCGSADGLVVNGGFEEPADGPATDMANWRRWGGANRDNTYRVNALVLEGQWALHLRAHPAGGSEVVQQRLADYEPGRVYEVSFQALLGAPHHGLTVDVMDRDPSMHGSAALSSRAVKGVEWTQHVLRFTAPTEPGHPLWLRFYPRGTRYDSEVYVDDVQVRELSDAAVEFISTHETVELDTFNAIVQLTYDLAVVFDTAKWRLDDLAHHDVLEQERLAQLRAQAEQVEAQMEEQLSELRSQREQGLMADLALALLPDARIAQLGRQLDALDSEIEAGVETARARLMPRVEDWRQQLETAAPAWQPPSERTAEYHPATLADRFHRIISYHGYMPPSEYLHRSMWELRPTAVQAYMNYEHRKPQRVDFLTLNQPRTIAYIESVRIPGFPMDLSAVPGVIDGVFSEIGHDPAFSGIQMDEPGISQRHVTTPEGYAQFRAWLAGRYPQQVGGFPIANAMGWELPDKLETDLDRVMWMELQQFRAHHFARQLGAVRDYIASKNPKIAFHVALQQYLPMEPQYCSYVTTSAALDWISVDPYNDANVGEAMLMDLLRSNSKGPNLLVVGTCYTSTAGRFAKDMSISFAHTGGVYNWCWVYMSKHRAPAGVTTGAWPVQFRGRWKEGMYEAAEQIMGKMDRIEPYLVHTDSGANVALVFSERTGIYCSRPDVPNTYYISNLGIYQALQQLHIPCEAIFAEAMTPERLARFKVLILADAELFTPEETEQLKAWCRQGGTIIALGAVGSRDQWGREHDDYGLLTELFGAARGDSRSGAKGWTLGTDMVKMGSDARYDAIQPVGDTVEQIGTFDSGDIAALRHGYGQGHAYLLAGRNLGYSFDGSKDRKGLYKWYWPGFLDNLGQLVHESLEQAQATVPVTAENAPVNVEVGLRKQGDRLVVHLLNYDDEGPVSGMSLVANGRAGQRAFIPEDGTEDLTTQDRSGDLVMPVRDFEHHICIVVEPR